MKWLFAHFLRSLTAGYRPRRPARPRRLEVEGLEDRALTGGGTLETLIATSVPTATPSVADAAPPASEPVQIDSALTSASGDEVHPVASDTSSAPARDDTTVPRTGTTPKEAEYVPNPANAEHAAPFRLDFAPEDDLQYVFATPPTQDDGGGAAPSVSPTPANHLSAAATSGGETTATPSPTPSADAGGGAPAPASNPAGQGAALWMTLLAGPASPAAPAGGVSASGVSVDPVEGASSSVTVATFTDGDGNTNPALYSATIQWGDNQSSAGTVSYASGSFQVTGSHAYAEEGTYAAVVSIHDSDGANTTVNSSLTVSDAALSWSGGSPTFSWTANPPGQPTVTNPGTRSNAEGDAVSLQISASDPNGYALTYDATGLPTGLSINSSTGLISGTVDYSAAESFAGSYSPTVLVSDGHGGSASTTFAWTVSDTNRAPTLTNPGSQSSALGSSVSLQLSATDPDSDTLTYNATGLPSGLTLDSYSGLISGTPDASAVATTPYAVTVTAADASLTATQTFNWTITAANQAPTLTSPGNQTNAAGDVVELSLAGSDSDGEAVTWTATGLPPGLAIEPSSGVISGTLANAAASATPYSVTVSASDGSTTASQSFTWTVNYVGITSPGDQGNANGDVVSLPVAAASAGGTLSYSATGLPSGLSIGTSTGIIAGTVSSTADANSPYSTTVTASDGTHSASTTFNWTVAHVSLTNPGDQNNREASAVSLQLQGSDADGDTLTWSATGLPTGLSLSSAGLISGTIGVAAHGSSPYQVTVTAADATHSASQSFVWTVTPRVALVNPGNQAGATGDSVCVQVQASTVGGTLTYSVSGLPPGLAIAAATGLISGTISSGASTTPYAVTVTASDGTSSSSQSFTWAVSPVSIPVPGDQTNLDGDAVSLSLAAHYHGTGTLSYSATGLPPGLSLNTATGAVSGTVANTADTNSPYSVTVTATDGTNSGSQTFNWIVNPRLTLAAPTDQSNAAGDVVSLTVSASDAGSGTVTYSATGLPSGLSINSSTGPISGTIATGADTNSPYSVTVTASDGSASTSSTFNWTVAHVFLANPGSQNSVDGDAVSLALQGHDADGGGVTYSATGLPSGLSVNSSTGVIAGTLSSSADQNGPYFVTATASDSGHSTSQSFLWYVTKVSLTGIADQTNTEGDTVSLSVSARGVGGTLSYTAGNLPPGLSINTTTGVISGTVAAGAADGGPYSVTVAASNGSVSSSQSFTWTINPRVNLTPPSDRGSVEGNTVSLQVVATDSASQPLTYTAPGLPTGLGINASTGLISGTVSTGTASGGPYAVVVTASEGTYSASDSFTWTVTAVTETAPTLTNPGRQMDAAGDSVTLALSASGLTGDALTFSATGLPQGLSVDAYTGVISGSIATAAASATPYSVTATVDDGNGGTASQTFQWVVNEAAVNVQANTLTATEGADTGGVTVTTFTTPDAGAQAGDFAATVNWGDGTTDAGTVSGGPGSFTVTGDHNYLEKGNYTTTVTVTADGGTAASASATATVADASLALTGGLGLGALAGQSSALTLATFTDANPASPATDFSATVNWGDGSSTVAGTVGFVARGTSTVSGSHTYSQRGTYTATVTLTDADGATATATSTVYVGDAFAGVPTTLSLSPFQDAAPGGLASDFTATVTWGDGSSTSGITATASGGAFTLAPVTHTYAADSISQTGGVYTVTVTISDDGGSTLSGSGTVAVVRPAVALSVANVATAPGSLSLSNAEVAAFTEPDASDSSGEFAATILWGDGTSSGGTVTGSGGLFKVLGSHTYAAADDYLVQVQLSQHWDALLAAAQAGGRLLAQGQLSKISGPHVVLGLAPKNFAANQGLGYWFSVTLPGQKVVKNSVTWTFDKNNVAKETPTRWLISSFRVTPSGTFVSMFINFLNTPAHLNLGLTYKLQGEKATDPAHKVQLFPVSIVQLTVQNPSLVVHNRFNGSVGPLRDDRRTYVKINTRGAAAYSYAKLQDNNATTVNNELGKGLVSFNATVILRGAGANKTEGVSSIHLGWLQTLVKTTFKVTYTPMGTATFRPMSGGRPLPPPWLDTNQKERTGKDPGTGGDSSFTRSSAEQKNDAAAPGGGKSRRVVSLDAPLLGFFPEFPMANNTWVKTTGGWSFVNHLTAFSTADGADSTNYTVIAVVPWSVYFVGKNVGGNWVKDRVDAKAVFDTPGALPALPIFGSNINTFTYKGPTFNQATNGGRVSYQ
jgi:hypothetical protein